jgi:hypothetical protein
MTGHDDKVKPTVQWQENIQKSLGSNLSEIFKAQVGITRHLRRKISTIT